MILDLHGKVKKTFNNKQIIDGYTTFSLQCFDTVGSATGRASGL